MKDRVGGASIKICNTVLLEENKRKNIILRKANECKENVVKCFTLDKPVSINTKQKFYQH